MFYSTGDPKQVRAHFAAEPNREAAVDAALTVAAEKSAENASNSGDFHLAIWIATAVPDAESHALSGGIGITYTRSLPGSEDDGKRVELAWSHEGLLNSSHANAIALTDGIRVGCYELRQFIMARDKAVENENAAAAEISGSSGDPGAPSWLQSVSSAVKSVLTSVGSNNTTHTATQTTPTRRRCKARIDILCNAFSEQRQAMFFVKQDKLNGSEPSLAMKMMAEMVDESHELGNIPGADTELHIRWIPDGVASLTEHKRARMLARLARTTGKTFYTVDGDMRAFSAHPTFQSASSLSSSAAAPDTEIMRSAFERFQADIEAQSIKEQLAREQEAASSKFKAPQPVRAISSDSGNEEAATLPEDGPIDATTGAANATVSHAPDTPQNVASPTPNDVAANVTDASDDDKGFGGITVVQHDDEVDGCQDDTNTPHWDADELDLVGRTVLTVWDKEDVKLHRVLVNDGVQTDYLFNQQWAAKMNKDDGNLSITDLDQTKLPDWDLEELDKLRYKALTTWSADTVNRRVLINDGDVTCSLFSGKSGDVTVTGIATPLKEKKKPKNKLPAAKR